MSAGGKACSRDLRLCGFVETKTNIVELRAHEVASCTKTSCDEHFTIGQQRRRVLVACGGEAAGQSPGPARRIVEFRARESTAEIIIETSRDEHLAVRQ